MKPPAALFRVCVDGNVQPDLRQVAGQTELALWQCYARCHMAFRERDIHRGLDEFIDDAARIRSLCSREEWQRVVRAVREDNRCHRQLLSDPFTRDAFSKPRGYPGDADTLDYVYGYRRAVCDDQFGEALFAASTNVPIARAVRSRRKEIASWIAATADSAVIATVGAGHMRELHDVERSSRRTFVAIDHDPVSLSRAAELHGSLRIVPMRITARSLMTADVRCPTADLIYSAGLFDYFDDASAAALLTVLARQLKPAGTLVVANLTLANRESAYMEAVMDWWMHYRDEEDLKAVAKLAKVDGTTRTFFTGDGRIAWLIVEAA